MNILNGHGREAAAIFLVEDYASYEDEQNGIGLSGKREAAISGIFTKLRFSLKETYRTTYIKTVLPYYGRAKKKFQEGIASVRKAIEPQNFDDLLLEELKFIAPNVVVPLGTLACKTLTQRNVAITSMRGSVLPLRLDWQQQIKHPVKVIPTLGAKYIWENSRIKAVLTLDAQRIIENSQNADPIKDPTNIWICKTGDAFLKFVHRYYDKSEWLFFDIEMFFGFPSCISFYFDDWNEAISVPLFDPSIDTANMAMLVFEISRLLASPIKKCNQNIKYDWIRLERFGFPVNNVCGDTQLAASLIYPEFRKSLEFLTSLYTDVPYYKDEGADYDPKHKKLFEYNAKDSLVDGKIHKAQLEELEEQNLQKFYESRMIPWLNIYKELEVRGIRVDTKQLDHLKNKYRTLQNNLTMEIREKVGEKDFNPGSPMQVGIVVYEELKFPIRRKSNESGRKSYQTGEEILEDLWINHTADNKYGEEGSELLKQFIAWRKIDRVLQYLDAVLYPDGCMRTSYNLGGTKTGRTSTGKLLDQMLVLDDGKLYNSPKMGIAFQTIPKHGFKIGEIYYGRDLRTMFVPRQGYVFVESDLSQAEARVDAVLSESWDILPKFDIPPGIHCLTASWVYNCRPEDIKKGTEEYQIGKTVRHAGERNMGSNRLSIMIHKHSNFCKTLLDRFHSFEPNIRQVFHAGIRELILSEGYLISPQGRRRDFFGKITEQTFNEAISQIPQATVSDRVKESMIEISQTAPWAHFVYENHDAHMVEVQKERREEYNEICKKAMEQPIDFNGCSMSRDFELTIPTETEWSDTNWMEMRG